MSHAKQTRRVTRASRDALLQILEALPGALFVVDDAATILYANTSAQALTEATPEEICGSSLWRGAPQLVSIALYQAVQKVTQTRAPMDIEYASPVTNSWLHVSLSPTNEGLMIVFHETLEPQHRQHALSRNDQMYRDLLESFADGVMIVTPDGLILDINQRPLADTHLRREEVVGTPLTDLPTWSSDPAVQQQLRVAMAQARRGETVHFEARISPRTGLFLDIEMTVTSHRDARQQVEYLICASRDITQCKRAEDELRTLVDAIPHFVWMAGPDGSITCHNQRLINYLALPSEQTEGNGWIAAVHPDDRQYVWEVWQTSVQTGTPYEVELRLQDGTSGAYRWVLVRGVPQRNAQGTIHSWIGTCTDIDERKHAEESVKASERNLRVLAETMPQLVWISQPDGRITFFNQRYLEYTHATFEQLRDHGWRAFLHPEDYQRTLTIRNCSLATGKPYETEFRLRNSQTEAYRWFLARAMPICDETGQIVTWFGTTTDIEQQKQTEEALRQSQQQVHALMRSPIIGIFVAEGEQIVDANDTFLRMTGYTRKDLRAGCMNWRHMTPPDYLARTQQAHQELATQQSMTPYEKEYVCQDGTRLPVLVGAVTFSFTPSQQIYFVVDNSARKELDQRKDDFIGMASHELRSPLTAVKMQAQLVRKRLERQSHHEAATALSRVDEPLKRLERLIAELLDVSKIQAGRLEYRQERVDLDALLQEITDTMQALHPSHSLVVRGTVGTNLIGDRDRLGQVFTNLLSNAIKYSPTAQTVEIDLSTAAETVTISVRDHGPGIPREQREKIFERFYRATSARQHAIPGLGIGLYLVAEIITHYGGTITVESQMGHGSTFTVTLPCTRESQAQL